MKDGVGAVGVGGFFIGHLLVFCKARGRRDRGRGRELTFAMVFLPLKSLKRDCG